MNSHQPGTTYGPHDTPLPTPTTIDPTNAIVLNVLSPSSEVPGGRISFPRIHLDTKLSQLKTRIRNVLQAAPAPERQRLIYRGHALLNADATLRQVLRPQGSTEPHSDTYTLHLVLPPGNITGPSVPASTEPATHNQAPAGLPQPPLQPGMPNGLPNVVGVLLPHHVLAQAQASQMMLQNQLNMLQQQLAGQNYQHQHVHPPSLPGMAGMNMLPNGMQATYQVHQHGQPGQQTPILPGFGFGIPNAAAFQAMVQQQQQVPHPAVAGHQPILRSDQPLADQLDTAMPEILNRDNVVTADTNEANEPNASQQFPATTRIQDSTSPQGQRIRTVVQESVNMTYTSRNNTPSPALPQPAATASQSPFAANTPGMNVPRSSQNSAPATQASQGHTQPTRHTPLPFMMPPPMPAVPAGPSTTMAWILLSPTGPEALLFAPGHGYFRSTPHASPARLASRNPLDGQGQNLAVVAQDRVVPPQPGQPVAAQALARLPHPNAIPAAQGAEENDFFNFILGRGWLFLRMYVFTFFISESNTWRRYFLLAVAAFICMLPRNNFLRRVIAQIRRHLDTLIGPPMAPPRDGAVPALVGAPTAPGGTPPAPEPTPAENAARLLHEHEARHPNVVRDALFRVERAAAMFLASLVPGVGERHVRAREDLRREAERLENERRAREEAEQAQVHTQADATQTGSAEVGSTAVETRDDMGEARERTTQAHGVETGA